MKMQVVFKNLEDPTLKESLRGYADKRLKNLGRYSRHILDGELTFEEERGHYNTLLVLRVKGTTLTAKSRGKDPFETIDQIKEKIKGQLVKYEEKLKLEDRRHRDEWPTGF